MAWEGKSRARGRGARVSSRRVMRRRAAVFDGDQIGLPRAGFARGCRDRRIVLIFRSCPIPSAPAGPGRTKRSAGSRRISSVPPTRIGSRSSWCISRRSSGTCRTSRASRPAASSTGSPVLSILILRAVQRLDWPRHDRCGCIERPHCGFRGVLCAHAWAALHRGGAPCEGGGADRCRRVPVWAVRLRRPHRDLGRALPERHRGYRSSTGRAVVHCGRGRSRGRGARCRRHRRGACAEGAAGARVRWLHRHPSPGPARSGSASWPKRGLAGSVVSMLCDQGERYASTYCNDQWVAATGLDRAGRADDA